MVARLEDESRQLMTKEAAVRAIDGHNGLP